MNKDNATFPTVLHLIQNLLHRHSVHADKRDVICNPNMNIVFTTCEPCISSKMTRLPFPKGQRSNELLAIIHSDVCGPLNIKTHRGML